MNDDLLDIARALVDYAERGDPLKDVLQTQEGQTEAQIILRLAQAYIANWSSYADSSLRSMALEQANAASSSAHETLEWAPKFLAFLQGKEETAAPIDTRELLDRLVAGGMPRAQAEGVAQVLRDINARVAP